MLCALIYVILVILLLICVESCFKNADFEKFPGPKGYPLLANCLEFLMEPVPLFNHFRKLANTYKNLFKFRMGTKMVLVVYNPEDVEVVLSNPRHNTKGFIYRWLEPWLQDGLLLSDGTKWLSRRKILTPTFHFNILKHFNIVLQENSKKLVEQLQEEVGKPETDVSTIIPDFTLNSICETAMGIKLDKESSSFGRKYKNGICRLGQLVVHRAQRVWMHVDLLFNLSETGRQQKRLLHMLGSFRDSVINKRRETKQFQYIDVESFDKDLYDDSMGKKRLAMLDLLLHAEKEGTIDAQGIAEEVDTFMFEGHDTTSAALQFALMLLANNTEAQENVVKECKQIFGSSDRPADMNDLAQMKYLECCIKETLRLYPPVHFIQRTINCSQQLRNYAAPEGVSITILIYDLHRRADQFVEPLAFRPERFLVEPTWHPYSYIPFSAGPRNCIGQKFAMMEMKLCLSNVVRRYRLLPVTKPRDVIFITDFILRANHPIYVKLENRC